MIKKISLLAIILIFMCGCSGEVNLTIDDNSIKEDISITFLENMEWTKENIKNSLPNYLPINKDDILEDANPDEELPNVEYYQRETKELNNGYSFNYKHDWNLKEYNKATSLNNAFRSFSIIKNEEDKTITLSTDNNGLLLFDVYPELDNVTINIKTDNEVIDSNTTPENNIYSWNFTRNDNVKNIYLVIKEQEKNDVTENKPDNEKEEEKTPLKSRVGLVSVVISIFIIFIVGVFVYKIKNNM